MKTTIARIYRDYLMPLRLGHYNALLQAAARAGYAQLSVRDFLHCEQVKRAVKVVNHEILDDLAFRRHCSIAYEPYDDAPHPVYFHPMPPQAALGHYQAICLLTHPAQWETNWGESTRCNVRRLVEGLAW